MAAILRRAFLPALQAAGELCVAHRWTVIGLTVAVFVLALGRLQEGVEKQFFPPPTARNC